MPQQIIDIGSGAFRPYVFVDHEAEWDAALAAGHSIVLRGEGHGGVISCTTTKRIVHPHTHIVGPCVVEFTLPAMAGQNPSAIEILADDCILENFEMRSTAPTTPETTFFGIVFEMNLGLGHRTVLRDVHVHNGWNRCISKRGNIDSPLLEDVLIERCYFHTFSAYPLGSGVELTYGFRRLVMRDCRILGRIGTESHLTGYGIFTGHNSEDCVFERVEVGNVDGMGLECNIADYTPPTPTTVNLRPIFRDLWIHDCGRFGLSIGHAKGAFLENIKIRNVVGRGIEIAGQVEDPWWAEVIGFDIETVRGNLDYYAGIAEGITVDKTNFGVRIHGGQIKDVISPAGHPNGRGIYLFQTLHCVVNAVQFIDAGFRYIDVIRGDGVYTGGYNVVENCVFRQTVGRLQERAIYNEETELYARNNSAFKRAGGELGFDVKATIFPANVRSENDMPLATGSGITLPFDSTVTTGGFVSSNVIYSIP
jgi:hypothetical protein